MTRVQAGVALTFDDGPDPEWTPRVLDELRRLGAVATFFVLASRAAAHPRVVRRMVREGHELALHGNLHLRHDEHVPRVIERDTLEALDLLGRRRRPRLWRPPHGIATQATAELAARLGLQLVHWTADSVDWQDARAPEAMLADLEPQLVPGAVVLMHDAVGPGAARETPAATVALLDPLVAAIRVHGLDTTLIGAPPPVPLLGENV